MLNLFSKVLSRKNTQRHRLSNVHHSSQATQIANQHAGGTCYDDLRSDVRQFACRAARLNHLDNQRHLQKTIHKLNLVIRFRRDAKPEVNSGKETKKQNTMLPSVLDSLPFYDANFGSNSLATQQ